MSNIDISGGVIKTKKDEIIIRSNNRNNTVSDEIKNIVVQSNINDGGIVRLKDVAVEMKFSDIPVKSYVNGQRSISFIIKNSDEDLKNYT